MNLLAICDDQELAGLDREMAGAFLVALRRASDQRTLQASQKRWLAERDGCLGNVACLRSRLSQRTSQLRSMVGQGIPVQYGDQGQKVFPPSPAVGGQTNLLLPHLKTVSGLPALDEEERSDADKFLMLVALSQDPDLLVTKGQVFATRFLPSSDPFGDVTKWHTNDEFADDDVRHAFSRRYADDFRRAVPRLPLRLMYLQKVGFQRYDPERHGFALYRHEMPIVREAADVGLRVAGSLDFEAAFWPIDEAAARNIVGQSRAIGRHEVRLATEIEISRGQAGTPGVTARWRHARLVDPETLRVLYDLGGPPSEEPAIPAGMGHSQPFASLANPPDGFRRWRFSELDGVPSFEDQLTLFRLIAAGNMPDFLVRGDLFTQRVGLAQVTLEQPIYDAIFSAGANLRGSDEFERGRSSARFSQLSTTLRDLAPKLPIEVTVSRRGDLMAYDGTRQGFRIAGSRDFGLNETARTVGLSLSRSFEWPDLFWPVSPEVGERTLHELAGSRTVLIGAHLRIDAVPSHPDRLSVKLVSMGLYRPRMNTRLYGFPVANDGPSLSEVAGQMHAKQPGALDDVLVCAGLLANPGPLPEQGLRTCTQIVRQRDQETYRTAGGLSSMSRDDARHPFFPRDGSDPGEDVTQRLTAWGKSYYAALSEHPVSYRAHSNARTSDGMSYDAVGRNNSQSGRLLKVLMDEHLRPEQVVDYGRLGDLPVVLVVPNLATQYAVAVPANLLNADSDGGGTATATLSMGLVEVVRDAEGKNVLAIHVKPLTVDVMSRAGATMGRRDLSAVPAFGESAPMPTAERQTPLPLDYALVDILAVRALGSKLPPEALAYAIARRWAYESASNAPIERYFPIGAPQPSAETAASEAGRFVRWVVDHAPSLPLQVVTTASVEVSRADPTIRWSRLPCFQPTVALLSTDNSLDMAANGRLAQCRRDADAATGPERAACDAAATKMQQRRLLLQFGSQCRSTEPRLGFADPFQAFAALDAEAPTPEITVLGGSERVMVNVTLDLVSVTGLGRNPRSAVLSEIEEYERDDGMTSDVQPFARFDLHVSDVAYSDSRTGAAVTHLSPSEASPTSPSARPADPRPPAVSADVHTLDMVGIRLGMPFDTAEKMIRDHMRVGSVVPGRRLDDERSKHGFIKPLNSGELFVSEDGKEMIALLDEPPAAQGRVMAAWRRVHVPTGTVLPSEVAADSNKKYGRPSGRTTLENGGSATWSPGGGMRCAGFYETTRFFPMSDDWQVGTERMEGNPQVKVNSSRLPVAFFDTTNKEFLAARSCGPTLTVSFNRSGAGNGTLDEVDTTLFDFGLYAEAYEDSRKRLQSGTSSSEAHIKF